MTTTNNPHKPSVVPARNVRDGQKHEQLFLLGLAQVGQEVLDLNIMTQYTITQVHPDGRVETDGHNTPIAVRPNDEENDPRPWVTGDFANFLRSITE